MGSKKTTTTSKETATTTPNVPDYALGPIQNYYGTLGKTLGNDPYAYATPANALQQQAYGAASGLGQNPLYGTASTALSGLLATNTPTAQLPAAASASAANAGNANLASAANAGSANQVAAANAGSATPVSLAGYQPGLLGNAQGYSASQAQAPTLGGTANTAQAESALSNLQSYVNPATQALVATTLANYDDQAARQAAAFKAQAGLNKAFGGSRYAIAESQLAADTARERALTEAGLRNQAWNNAVALSQYDTTNRQNTGFFNADAQNQRDESLAGLQAQIGMFNTGALNDAAAFGANAANQYGLAQFDANNTAAQFGANAANQSQMFNADAANQMAQFNAGLLQNSSLANMQAANDFALANAGYQQQANLANADSANNFALANAGYQQQANLANAQAANDFALTGYGAENQMAQFNANQQIAAAQALGGLAGQMSDNERSNLMAQLTAGANQWDVQNQYNTAPLNYLSAYGQLLDPALLQAITGQTINSSGTSTQKQSGGLLGTLAGIAGILATPVTGGLSGTLGGAMLSDRRLKTGIEKLGEMDDGLGVYRWTYIWGEGATGVMADEVAVLRPWALGPEINGFATVNYGAL